MIINNKFNKRIENLPESIYQLIDNIDLLKSKWVSGAKLDPQVLGKLKKFVLITSTGASTRIEGSELSDEDVERLMRGLSIQKFKNRDKQEAQGYYEILTNIFDSYKSIPFSESTIKFFHKELLKYTEKDKAHRGNYKTSENKVVMMAPSGEPVKVLFDTTEPWLTPKEMQELVEWTQNALLEKQIHPLIIMGNFIVEFLNIHPFMDGNGRLSRILSNLLLLQQGYEYMPYVSQEKLIEDNKPEYYVALRQSQKTFRTGNENLVPWLTFFFKIVSEQSERAVILLSHEEVHRLLSPQQNIVWEYISKSASTVAPLEISQATKIPRPTINQALVKLLRLKWIEKTGLGRATRYKKR
ncbi:MAG: Fic family protein [Candidatus Buchananbacteria bacterium]|jgi:Fic family protein